MPTLQFKGKNIVQNHHLAVPYHTLDEIKELGYSTSKEIDIGNLLIEGDNLTALKALLPNYTNKIDLIYIDPPYNTGNEKWIYNDNVSTPMLKEWFGKIVDKDDLTRHDKWLCMMLPRLKLLQELLKENGVIFISIDNNEIHRLRILMDEVFGVENFVTQIANINNPKGRSDDKYVPTAHEYLLVYKNSLEPKLYGWEPEDKVLKRYRKEDENGQKWREIDLRKTGDNDLREDRINLFYYFLFNNKTKQFYPTREEKIPKGFIQIKPVREDGKEGNWRWELNTAKDKIDVLFPKLMPKRKVWSVFEMDYFEADDKIKPTTAWTKKEFNSERGTESFVELGFDKNDFPKPKPVGLIRHILEFATDKNSIILDSFAGSGTTAQAVLELNNDDGGKRKFILVQMPESTVSEPKKNICKDLTRERIKRAIDNFDYKSSFKYLRVGIPLDAESMLDGKLPTYKQFAEYVYYLCTGDNLDDIKAINEKDCFVGKFGNSVIYLIYKQDFDKLTRLALNLTLAEKIKKDYPKKKVIVYAPACFLDEEYLDENQIHFVSIPYDLFQRNY
jgi:adenine-specific DNA-methyltransferase